MRIIFEPDCQRDVEFMANMKLVDKFQDELYKLCSKYDKQHGVGFYISGQSWIRKNISTKDKILKIIKEKLEKATHDTNQLYDYLITSKNKNYEAIFKGELQISKIR